MKKRVHFSIYTFIHTERKEEGERYKYPYIHTHPEVDTETITYTPYSSPTHNRPGEERVEQENEYLNLNKSSVPDIPPNE